MSSQPHIAGGATHILVGCRRPGCVRTAKQSFPICSTHWKTLPPSLQGDFGRSMAWLRAHPPRSQPRDIDADDRLAERCLRAAWRHAARVWAAEDVQREAAACP